MPYRPECYQYSQAFEDLCLTFMAMTPSPCAVKVLYGADNQSFGNLCIALRKGEARDGPVTLVLERQKKFRRGG